MLVVDARQPIVVICGHRGQQEQDAAFKSGASRVQFPNSKHNKQPSLAVDIAPAPLDWKNIEAFKKLRVVVEEEATKLGIKLRPLIVFKNGSQDHPHYELEQK
jgi:hypothetical protein